jgi:dipeptidyl aminopeptidase/acylaminoacyl peptidase
MALIVQTTRFKAGIVQAGYADMLENYGTMLHPLGINAHTDECENWFGGTPWEKRSSYIENSPIYYLDRVKTPVLLVHGTADRAVSNALSDEIFTGLRRLGKEVTYTRYEGEGHFFYLWSRANQADMLNRRIAWFDRWLKETPSVAENINSK